MKRFLLTAALLFAWSSPAFALPGADTCEEHVYPVSSTLNKSPVGLLIYCQTATDAATLTGYAISANTISQIAGMYAYEVVAFNGATGVTDNSDLTIIATMSVTNPIFTNAMSYDILGGNGTDLLDNATTSTTITQNATLDLNQYTMIDEKITYTVNLANNSVNNAGFGILIHFDYP